MKNKFIAIGLFHDRIDLLTWQGGRVLASRRLPSTFDASADEWASSLRKAGPLLGDAVREMKLTGWNALAAYRSPTSSSDYVTVKVNRASEARTAAILNVSDSLGFPLALAVTESMVIAGDHNKAGQTHLVVTAERDDHATALADLIQEAGLKFVSATPIDAAIMMKVAQDALLAGPSLRAHLYVGEQRSFFVIVHGQSLVFARPIGLGIDALATSLTRPMRGGTGAEPAELDATTARGILHQHGFPARDKIVHETLGLTGSQIIPLLQPVLQRFVVELRQSLRFGLAEDQRQSVPIWFTGPGSAIPGFAQIVAGELRLEVRTDPAYSAGHDDSPHAGGSELMDAFADTPVLSRLNLLPQELGRQRQVNRLQRWMWTGAAAALAVVAFDAYRIHGRLNSVRAQAQTVNARNAEAQAVHESSAKMFAAVEAMTNLDHTIASQVGAQVNFRACMQEIASLVPQSVRLTEIRFHQSDGKTTGSVLGYAFPQDQSNRNNDLEMFIARLGQSPLFDSVAIANVQVGSVQSRQAQQFEVTLVGVASPGPLLHAGVEHAQANRTQQGGELP